MALFFTFALAYSTFVNIERRHFGVCYIYLTHQNICVTVFTTWLGAILVTAHHLNRLDVEKEMTGPMKLHWMLWNQTIVFSAIITLGYWYSPHDDGKFCFQNYLIHGLNFFVLAFDLFIVGFPARFSNFIFIFPAVFSYTAFTIVYQMLGGLDKWVSNKKNSSSKKNILPLRFGNNFVYPKADWKNDPVTASVHVVAFFALTVFFHFLFNMIHVARRRFHRKMLAKTSFDLNTISCGVDKVWVIIWWFSIEWLFHKKRYFIRKIGEVKVQLKCHDIQTFYWGFFFQQIRLIFHFFFFEFRIFYTYLAPESQEIFSVKLRGSNRQHGCVRNYFCFISSVAKVFASKIQDATNEDPLSKRISVFTQISAASLQTWDDVTGRKIQNNLWVLFKVSGHDETVVWTKARCFRE